MDEKNPKSTLKEKGGKKVGKKIAGLYTKQRFLCNQVLLANKYTQNNH